MQEKDRPAGAAGGAPPPPASVPLETGQVVSGWRVLKVDSAAELCLCEKILWTGRRKTEDKTISPSDVGPSRWFIAVSALDDIARESRQFCMWCQAEEKPLPLQRCAGCRSVSYCSRDHQRLDWPHHRPFCTTASASLVTARETITRAHAVQKREREKGTNAHDEVLVQLLGKDLNLVRHQTKGRMLETTRAFRAGEVVLRSHCAARLVSLQRLSAWCSNCLRRHEEARERRRECSRCHAVSYCGQICEERDGKGHRRECEAFMIGRESPGLDAHDRDILLLALRINLRIPSAESGTGEIMDQMRSLLDCLLTHEKSLTAEEKRSNSSLARRLCNILEEVSGLALTSAEALHLVLRIRFNSHPLEASGTHFGLGMFPVAAACVNHSCSPNTLLSREGEELTLRALGSIAQGHEVTYGYIDIYQDGSSRHRLLEDAFKFKCQCPRCLKPEQDVLSELICPRCHTLLVHHATREVYICPSSTCGRAFDRSRMDASCQQLQAKLMQASSLTEPRLAVAQLLELHTSNAMELLHPAHSLRMDLALALMEKASMLRDWPLLESTAKAVIDCWTASGIPYSANIAMAYHNAALALLLGVKQSPSKGSASTMVEKALEVNQICFGEEAETTQRLRKAIKKLSS